MTTDDRGSYSYLRELGWWLVICSLLLNLVFVAEHVVGLLWLSIRKPLPAFVCDPPTKP